MKKGAHGGNMVSPVRASRRRSGMSQTELESVVGEVLIEPDALSARVAELGAEISADYAGRDLLLIGVLKGAVFFMADLMRKLTIPCEVDFMAISSYGASTDSSGVVRILKDLDINIEGRHVLVVEDIIDSGLTLSYLVRNLSARARVARGLRTSDEAGAARDRCPRALHRVRDPESLRDRLRTRLRRALPQSPVRWRARRGARARRRVAGRSAMPLHRHGAGTLRREKRESLLP